jgi:hypothetical protein
MRIEDPFWFYPGDFTLFYAVTVELMVRKLLDEHGYNQKEFGSHIDMTAPLKGQCDVHPYDNVAQAIDFIEDALTYLGYRSRRMNEEGYITIAVRLPKNSDVRVGVKRQLVQGPFDPYYDVKLGKHNTVFYLMGEEFGHDWRCLVNIIQGILKLKGGSVINESLDRTA